MMKYILASAALVFASLGLAQAASLERDGELIAAFPIEGLTLSMTPPEARTSALAAGFIEESRGGPDPDNPTAWQYSKGESYKLNIAHNAGVMTSISLRRIPSRGDALIDYRSEINRIRTYFGVTGEEKACMANDRGGVCSVTDGADGVYFAGMQTTSYMLNIQLERHYMP